MSSLHQDRLLVEGPQPTGAARRTSAPAPGTGSPPVATTAGKAEDDASTPRSGKHRSTKPTRTKSAAARRRRSFRSAAAGDPADVGAPLALTGNVDAADLTESAEAQAREVVVDVVPAAVLPGSDEQPVDAAEVASAGTEERAGWIRSRLLAPRRRPALCLAAAVVGALGVSVTAGEPQPAQAGATTVSESVSVAVQLGIELEAPPIEEISPEAAAERLGELAASRSERDTEQAQAAQVQSRADQAAAEAAKAAAAAAAEAARPDAVLPVQGARLTSGFGSRWGALHAGIDLAAPMMTPEYAVMDGVVLEAGPASGFGNAVYIRHENGDVTVYGHMEQILVSAGQVVRAGETIALLGNRGQSTGPHLHFEVHIGGMDGTKIDPLPWLRERGVDV